jgi:hypothetical protein
MGSIQSHLLFGRANHSYQFPGRLRYWAVALLLGVLMMGVSAADAASLAQPMDAPGTGPSTEAAICPLSIGFGETIQCSIGASGEQDSYIFAASAGDKVLVRMSKTSGNIWPGIQVYGPDGTKLCDTYGSTTAEADGCALPSAGMYTILAFDGYNGTYAGDYSLYLQRMNNPGSPISIGFGQTLSGTITTAADMDTYTFTASAGDKVLVRMSKGTGSVWPEVRVYGPDGTRLCVKYGSPMAEIASCALTSTGMYTLLAFDSDNAVHTGDYYLFLQRLNNAGNAVPIGFGQTLSGTIATAGETDTYTFTASAGDMVLVRMSKTSGNIWPGIRVYGPDGTKLCDTYGSTTARIASCALASAGMYTILAFDGYNGTYAGDYSLYLQSAGPVNPAPLTFGTAQEFEVTPDMSTWFRIDVPAGADNVYLALQKYNSWSGEIKLYNGAEVLDSASGYGDLLRQWPSLTAGTYFIEVSGNGGGRITAYLSLPELTLGQWVVGSIYSQWGSAWYQFTVPTGQSTIHMRVETIGLWSRMEVYRDSLGGTLAGTANGPSMSLDIQSTPAGTYYVQLRDSAWIYGNSQTRDHMIRVDANPIIPPGCTTPVIGSLTPTKGGTAGTVTISISGQCLDAQATVEIKRDGSAAIVASLITGADEQRSLDATFDLTGAEAGEWNLVVTNPDTQSATAATPFTVESGGAPELWVEVIGRDQIRAGQNAKMILRVGNKGTVDTPAEELVGSIWEISNLDETAGNSAGSLIDGESASAAPLSFSLFSLPLLAPGRIIEIPLPIQIQTIQCQVVSAQVEPELDIHSCPQAEAILQLLNEQLQGYLQDQAYYQNQLREKNRLINDPNTPEDEKDKLRDERDGIWRSLDQLTKDIWKTNERINRVKDWISKHCTQANANTTGQRNPSGEFQSVGLADEPSAGGDEAASDNKKVCALASVSPEDKYGPIGYDAIDTSSENLQHWIPNDQRLDYRVDFWNKPDAPAATVDVIITDQLDPDLDWSTFEFSEIGFLDWRVPIEGGQYFNVNIPNVTIDFSKYFPGQPSVAMTVNAIGTFSPTTGAVQWEFHALDPGTLEPPENPYAGFLPPMTDSGWEMGWVNFSAAPKAGLETGATIENQAFVKFDVDVFKPAPSAGPFVNTLDALPPSSQAQAPSGTQACNAFTVGWGGQDDEGGSGLRDFTVYVDDLGDTKAAEAWKADITTTSALFQGLPGHTYGFYTRARDHVGNMEAAPEPLVYDVEVTAGPYCIYLPLLNKGSSATSTQTAPQDLSGWTLVSVVGPQTYYFPAGYVLNPGATVRIESYTGAGNNPPNVLRWSTAAIWANTGDILHEILAGLRRS